MGLLAKALSVGGGRRMRRYESLVREVGGLEPSVRSLSDEGLAALTPAFRERIERGEPLDEILPEAFAAAREAARRALGLRCFDVQLIGGMAMHDGCVAEMATGEGKTLAAVPAAYLNALPGSGVHVVTVNDYLAGRDAAQMGRVFSALGMGVGLVTHEADGAARRAAYACDVTYGTDVEMGFDYLRDNMAARACERVRRGFSFAIVDEADSVLIDEARTPLIISGMGASAAEEFRRFALAVPRLKAGADYEVDEVRRTVVATEAGVAKVEAMLGIDDVYADPTGLRPRCLMQALRAEFLYRRDVDYVVEDGEVRLVDEFTGRIMEGRRFSEGLHQALEAKERVRVRPENQTLASVTVQNYFRLYPKLAGMTGTAATDEAELREIYGLEVVRVPTNRPVVREDAPDLMFRTEGAKLAAVADEVERCRDAGRPVLVGTASVEKSERLSGVLAGRGVAHEVLNAKNHAREAEVVAQAGRAGAVTIATNMAGRGTDILLGGADASMDEREAVRAAGGLMVIGTERHESRRIDDQLRGRAGRQGDPGASRFFLSLEDELLRLFGDDAAGRLAKAMDAAGVAEGGSLQSDAVSKAVGAAQRQVEGMRFGARKNVLDYDDVLDRQRRAVYARRDEILGGGDVLEGFDAMLADAVGAAVAGCCQSASEQDWDLRGLRTWLVGMTGLGDVDLPGGGFDDDPERLAACLEDRLRAILDEKAAAFGEDALREVAGQAMLRAIDLRWTAHLQDMDYLKAGIGLRAIGQRDPLTEYREEAHAAFARLVDAIHEDFLRTMLRLPTSVAGG